MTSRAYQKTLKYILGLTDYSQIRGIEHKTVRFDTERIFDFLQRLGDPHRRYQVIHIAGTKGKGSIAALLSSALQAAGLKVGLYTSPYLFEFREQIRINGRSISQQALINTVAQLKPQVELVPGLTAFEATTGIAFFHFFQFSFQFIP